MLYQCYNFTEYQRISSSALIIKMLLWCQVRKLISDLQKNSEDWWHSSCGQFKQNGSWMLPCALQDMQCTFLSFHRWTSWAMWKGEMRNLSYVSAFTVSVGWTQASQAGASSYQLFWEASRWHLEKSHQFAKQRPGINLLITMTFFFPTPQRRIARCKMLLELHASKRQAREKFCCKEFSGNKANEQWSNEG
jgi:hypothetical protein